MKIDYRDVPEAKPAAGVAISKGGLSRFDPRRKKTHLGAGFSPALYVLEGKSYRNRQVDKVDASLFG